MGTQLDDSAIDTILDTYQQVGSINKTYQADGVDVSKATVSKYVNAWKDNDLPDEYDGTYANPGSVGTDGPNTNEPQSFDDKRPSQRTTSTQEPDAQDSVPDGFTAEPLSMDDGSEDDHERDPDFSSMDEGEFINWFFGRTGFGVRDQFENTLAEVCRVRGELPNEAEMANRIKESSSGIGKDADAEMIAETYWASAKNFMQENDQGIYGQGNQGQRNPGGDWVGSNEQQTQPRNGGNWVSNDGGQNQRQRQANQRRGQQNGRNDRRQRERSNGRSLSDPKQEQMMEQIKKMQEQQQQFMKTMMRQQNSGGDDAGTEDVMQRMETFQQLQDMFSNDDDGNNEELKALYREIQDLKAKEGGGDGGGEMGKMELLANLATQEGMDEDKLSAMAGLFGETDPDVRKAELEVEKEERRLQSRRELVDNVMEGLQDVAPMAMGQLASQLGGDDDGDDGAAAPPNQQPPNGGQGGGRAQPSPQTQDSGDLHVVGENTDGPGGGGSDDGLSPAAERHADRFQGAGNDSLPDLREEEDDDGFDTNPDFRGPGGTDRDTGEMALDAIENEEAED